MIATAAADPADDSSSVIVRFQKAAARARLSHSALWRALVHYEPNWMHGGVHSEVASPWFFLAGPPGRHDPAAELDATIAALFSSRPIGPRKLPAYCLFVARRKFLVKSLHIDVNRLPVHHCPKYQRWKAMIDAQSADLVFPAAFPNSPSSMFGHTLLRIDSRQRRAGTDLLSYAVNFAAAAPNDHKGLDFVWKGLTGGYPGVFGLFPYYEKVKQYAWIENRDVWSYKLNLSPAALDRLVDHVWEMDRVRFKYYFLNKNCAYQLLSLIDVARPGLHLTRQYTWYAIPSDTIRSLAAVPGLLGPAHFRPSMEASLRSETHQLSGPDQALARAVERGQRAPDAPAITALPVSQAAGVLEVAYDALNYQLSNDAIQAPIQGQKGRDYANRILVARAKLGVRSPFKPVPVPARSPETGHRSLRVNASVRHIDDRALLTFRIRPAYHDLLDNPGGYTRGQGIDFADAGFAIDPANGHAALTDVTLLSITSISRRDAWFKPVSFTLSTGARRRPLPEVFTGQDNPLGYYLQGGPGLAWGRGHITGYVFGQFSLDANPGLAPAYAVAVGPNVGVLYDPAPGVQMRLDTGLMPYALGAPGYYGWAGLGVQVPLVRNFALRSHIRYEATRRSDDLRIDFGLQAYF